MFSLFNRHPQSVGETYVEHMGQAWSFALPMLGAGLACLIHGILPFAFERTGSTCISTLHTRIAHRGRAASGSTTPEVAQG